LSTRGKLRGGKIELPWNTAAEIKTCSSYGALVPLLVNDSFTEAIHRKMESDKF